ncbi:FAD:protein FMN transferase [Methylovorus sp. MP688]|uniref:FAD:protein FMN transferase n=1 Tax=Methylovorus sp. (strain MP688) TaxID=887061 RepID=UPI0001EC466B|nr:FAD:protein FMN transferase [Methylovorus sp. MP688]ADQ84288.1 ApbE family lipoprotein [Methylovorus sp. MP688]
MTLPLEKHKRATIALGTIVEVSLWLEPGTDPSPLFETAYQAIRQVHALMSVHDDHSDLGRYRLASDGEPITIHAHTLQVLEFAETLWSLSDGMFDVCIGDVLARAAYLPEEWVSTVPQDFSPRQPLEITSHEDGTASLKKQANTLIDLGGIAKGYAVDLAIEALQAMGVPSALINAGGDMRIYGTTEAPIHRRQHQMYVPLGYLHNQALATSGQPSNRDTALDQLPIVDPNTRQCLPALAHPISIVANTAMAADALTKLAWLNALNPALLERYHARLIH